jgi:hypothetical protein
VTSGEAGPRFQQVAVTGVPDSLGVVADYLRCFVGHPPTVTARVDGCCDRRWATYDRGWLLPNPIHFRATAVHNGRFWSFAGRPRRND